MKRQNLLLATSALMALSACADLGFGDLPLADMLDGEPGAVQLSELQDGAGVPAEAPAATAAAFGPPNAKPGECYARVEIPGTAKSTTRQVLVSPATTKVETIPAKYKTVEEQVLVTAATTKTEVVPATYKTVKRMVPADEPAAAEASETTPAEYETVTERVLVKPAETKTVTVPAVYETVNERVKVKDAYTEWKPGGKVYAIGAEALGGTILANRVTSSGVMCLVEVPAEYKTVTKRVLVTPEQTKEDTTEAVYETVTRRVLKKPEETRTVPTEQKMKEVEVRVIDQPATVRTVPVPAEYKTVTKRVIDTPAVTRTVPVPAVYRSETVRTPGTPGETKWVEVLCDVNATPDIIRSLQRALKARDMYDGPIDGIVGPLTRDAIKTYQDGTSEVLSMESARELGLTS